jgi:DNA-binding response OmpR family regulator
MAICDRCRIEMAILAAPCPYPLTPTQRLVWASLKANQGRLTSRERVLGLLNSGRADSVTSRTLDCHVMQVRRKIAADYKIRTLYSQGWILTSRAA